jgi:hypothetical protein
LFIATYHIVQPGINKHNLGKHVSHNWDYRYVR